AAEIKWIIDDRHEKIRGCNDRLIIVEAIYGGIVRCVGTDQEVGIMPARQRVLEQFGEHAWRDLAAAAAAMRERSQSRPGIRRCRGSGHCCKRCTHRSATFSRYLDSRPSPQTYAPMQANANRILRLGVTPWPRTGGR